jgi:hypothetical protein
MILTYGIDSIYLSICAAFIDSAKIYEYLDDLKRKSKELKINQVGSFDGEYFFEVFDYGSRGYEYILNSNDFCFKVMRTDSKVMPNILLEIRSEILWAIKLKKSVNKALEIIRAITSNIEWVKISRVDICCDSLLDEKILSLGLMKKKRTRAKKTDPHFDGDELEGITFGRGILKLRVYDKAKEIKKSNKQWFYTVWGLNEADIPKGKKIIRFEFQVMRDVLKSFLISEIDDLYECLNSLWGYLVNDWFFILKKKSTNPDYQEVADFWKELQGIVFEDSVKEIKKIKNVVNEIDQKRLSKDILNKMALLMASEIVKIDLEREPTEFYWDYDYAFKVWLREVDKFSAPNAFEGMVKKRLIKYDRVQYSDEVPF